jgi:hypothetical protein
MDGLEVETGSGRSYGGSVSKHVIAFLRVQMDLRRAASSCRNQMTTGG